MFCEECGKTIVRPQAKFCPYCGHKIDHQPIVNAAPAAPAVQMPEISAAKPAEEIAPAAVLPEPEIVNEQSLNNTPTADVTEAASVSEPSATDLSFPQNPS